MMKVELHEYAGITYAPIKNEFSVVIQNGWRSQLVGYFNTLEIAIEERNKAIIRKENDDKQAQ